MRLFWLYFSVWVFPLSSALWYESPYNVGISTLSQWYMLGLMGQMFIFSLLASFIFAKKPSKEAIINKFNEFKSINFHLKCIYVWYSIFIIEVIISGGAPIVWGAEKSYGDFGLPVLHGFSNMLRGMIFSHLVLFSFLNFKLNKYIIWLSLFPLVSALIVEQSRGAFLMTICFALGPVLLFFRPTIGKILISAMAIPVLIMTLSVFQFLRYSESAVEELYVIADFVVDNESAYEKLLEPVFNYIATPALNAGLTIDESLVYNLNFSETVKPIVPSPFRPLLWDMNLETKDDYGALVNEAFNTSTFITPVIRDFGLLGGWIFFSIFFLTCIYIYQRASIGSVENIVRLSPIAMCIALSFFTSYMFSLVTIFYILLSGPVARIMKSEKS